VSTGASSVLVHAARARTAATRTMRFICDISSREGANVVKRRSVHAVAMLVVGAAKKLPYPVLVSSGVPPCFPLVAGVFPRDSVTIVSQ
jgi:hypothetical protein